MWDGSSQPNPDTQHGSEGVATVIPGAPLIQSSPVHMPPARKIAITASGSDNAESQEEIQPNVAVARSKESKPTRINS